MVLWLGLLFLIVTEPVNVKSDATTLTIFPKEPEGFEDENLEIRVDVTNYPFQNCRFSRGNISIDSSSKESGLGYWENKEKSTCKLLFTPLKVSWNGPWNVTLVDSTDQTNTGYFSLETQYKSGLSPVETTVNKSAAVGSSFSQACAYGNKLYAKVFDPKGRLISEGPNAQINIPFVRMEDSGTWLCLVQMSDRLFEVPVFVNLNVTSTALVETAVEETNELVNLLCRQIDVRVTPCLFETPNGSIIAPREGIYTDRYSYYGQNIYNECGLSIKKPLEEGEKGVWKCLMASPIHASFLRVAANNITTHGSTKASNVSMVTGTSLTIQCSLRQPLTYCYVRSPIGRIFSTRTAAEMETARYTGLGLGQGDCQITIGGAWRNESGTWQCGMGSEGLDDIQVPIHVQITESQFSAVAQQMAVNTGESVNLSCRSILGYGLRYCRFMHPSGRSLNVGSHTLAASAGVSYTGNGLEAGECGITIVKVETEDLGTWTCATAFVGDQWPEEFRDSITLTKTTISFGSLVGLSVALGLVAMVAVGGLIFWDQKRRNRSSVSVFDINNMLYQPQSRRSSENSDTETASRNGLVNI